MRSFEKGISIDRAGVDRFLESGSAQGHDHQRWSAPRTPERPRCMTVSKRHARAVRHGPITFLGNNDESCFTRQLAITDIRCDDGRVEHPI
jgi:hypothetical protein